MNKADFKKNSMGLLEDIKNELELAFPHMTFTIGKRAFQKCIIAYRSKYRGADIFVKNDKIIVEAAIPEMRTRLLIGSGALLLKMFKRDFSVPAGVIIEYLSARHSNVRLRE